MALVGFALGYPLPPGSRWWQHLRGEHEGDAEFTREDGTRTFALNELMLPDPISRCSGTGP